MDKNNSKASLGVTIFLLIIAIILIYFGVKNQSDSDAQKDQLTKAVAEQGAKIDQISEDIKAQKPSDFPDYDATQGFEHRQLVQNFDSWTPDAKLDPSKTKTVVVVSGGRLAKAYFLIKVKQGGKPLTKWESVYLKLDNVGGHLFRPQTLKVPPSEDTTLLYALDDVPYLSGQPYSEQRVPDRANWFKMFEPGKNVEVVTFISSLVPATIEDISLYYQCAGSEACSVEVVK